MQVPRNLEPGVLIVRLMAQAHAGHLNQIENAAAHRPANLRVVVAGHPDPVATLLKQPQCRRVALANSRFGRYVVKAVSKRNHPARRVTGHCSGQRSEGGGRVIGRQEDPARGIGRTLFQMQIGDDQHPLAR
jgi:hypothetical protein